VSARLDGERARQIGALPSDLPDVEGIDGKVNESRSSEMVHRTTRLGPTDGDGFARNHSYLETEAVPESPHADSSGNTT
jgi:hypothetical protein